MKTINKVFLILLVSLAAAPLFAQSDLSIGSLKAESEIKTFVQKVERTGYLAAVVQAADGGYVTVTDRGSSRDETSYLVRKIKVSGQKQWERQLDFLSNYLTIAGTFGSIRGIAQTTDGGFVLVGEMGFYDPYTRSEGTLVKLRPNGTVAWKKSFGVSGQVFTGFSSVIATPDGGVIAIGVAYARSITGPLVVRFAATGDVVWGKSFKRIAIGVSFIPLITSTATPDNGFIVAFPTSTNVSNQPLDGVDAMKITNSGIVVWEKSLKTGPAFVFQSVGITTDGGVMIVGPRKNSNKLKIVVLKADGILNWKAGYSLKVPGGIQSALSPIQTPDGGFVLTGRSYVPLGKKYYGFIAKIDSSRKVAFQNTFGNGPAMGRSVFVTADGGSMLLGSSGHYSSDLLVLKVNSEGIVAGCDFFQSLGATTRTSFGRLRIHDIDKTESDDLTLEPTDFVRLTSVVTSHPVSTECH